MLDREFVVESEPPGEATAGILFSWIPRRRLFLPLVDLDLDDLEVLDRELLVESEPPGEATA